VGSLPGGAKKYLDTLAKCLELVEERNPSETEFDEWFRQEFPSVKSKRSVKDCTRTFESLGLMVGSRDGFALTDKAKEFLKTHDKKILYVTLDNRYVAVHDILQLLREKPLTLEEIVSSLASNTSGVKWETGTQYSLRLNWLLGLGYVIKNGRYFSLTEEGIRVVEEGNEMVEEHPTHREIQKHIAETGQLLGRSSEIEYNAGSCVLDVVWKEIEEGDPAFVFEVLLKGNLSDALARLKYARYKFGRPQLYLVTNRKHMSKAKNVIRTSFRELADVIQVIHWKDIDTLKESAMKFLRTSRKMKFMPRFILRHATRIKPHPAAAQKKHQNTSNAHSNR